MAKGELIAGNGLHCHYCQEHCLTSIVYNLSIVCSDTVIFEGSELDRSDMACCERAHHKWRSNVVKLKQYNVNYKKIREFAGQNLDLHMTGGIMLPITKERFDCLNLSSKGKSAAQALCAEYTANDDNNWS